MEYVLTPDGTLRFVEIEPIKAITDSLGSTWTASGLCGSFKKDEPVRRVWNCGFWPMPRGTTITIDFADGASFSFVFQIDDDANGVRAGGQ